MFPDFPAEYPNFHPISSKKDVTTQPFRRHWWLHCSWQHLPGHSLKGARVAIQQEIKLRTISSPENTWSMISAFIHFIAELQSPQIIESVLVLLHVELFDRWNTHCTGPRDPHPRQYGTQIHLHVKSGNEGNLSELRTRHIITIHLLLLIITASSDLPPRSNSDHRL